MASVFRGVADFAWEALSARRLEHFLLAYGLQLPSGMSVSAHSLLERGKQPRSPGQAIASLIREILPGARVERVLPFGVDSADAAVSSKGMGYGKPVRVEVRDRRGRPHVFVLHTATANPFGHDRRADRAAEMLLAYDTFGLLPRHTEALDVGAIADDGRLVSLRGTGEFYLLTSYAPGRPYAEDLRAIMAKRRADAEDVRRAEQLASYLAALHQPLAAPVAYVRSIRDLVGSGEGIFGIVDGYPEDSEPGLVARLRRIEAAAVGWRWDLKRRTDRATRIHGDFHPFNLLFDDHGRLSLLDASRGAVGDPADDVMALAVNYVFFALQAPGSWRGAFRPLWQAFFARYFTERSDREIFEVAAPFLAWRLLVVACPRWYPTLEAPVRDKLLWLAEEVLASPRFDPEMVEGLFP